MGNIVSYFLTKPESAAAVEPGEVARENKEDRRDNGEELAATLEHEKLDETPAVYNVVDKMNINEVEEERETFSNVKEDEFEVIQEDKALDVNNVFNKTEDIVERGCFETEEISMKPSVGAYIEPIPETDNNATTEAYGDITLETTINVEGIEDSVAETANEDMVNAEQALISENIVETVSQEPDQDDSCGENISFEDINSTAEPSVDTTLITENVEVIGSIQDSDPVTAEENMVKLEASTPEYIKDVSHDDNMVAPVPRTESVASIGQGEPTPETVNGQVIEVIGSIQDIDLAPAEEPHLEQSEPISSQQALVEQVEGVTMDTTEEPEPESVKDVSVVGPAQNDDINMDDTCSCPHPELSNVLDDAPHCPHPELSIDIEDACHCPHPEMSKVVMDDACHCPHPEMSNVLDGRENCCGLVENDNIKAPTTFLVDESGNTSSQLVYNLSEQYYGFKVMEESAMKFPAEKFCNNCNCECDEKKPDDLDDVLDLPGSTQDPAEQPEDLQDIEVSFLSKKCNSEEVIIPSTSSPARETTHDSDMNKEPEQNITVEPDTEKNYNPQTNSDATENVPDVETIGSIQDSESDTDSLEDAQFESKIESAEVTTQTSEPIKDTFLEPTRIPSPIPENLMNIEMKGLVENESIVSVNNCDVKEEDIQTFSE